MRFAIRDLFWVMLVLGLLLAWGLDKWHSQVRVDDEMYRSRRKVEDLTYVINRQRDEIRAMRSKGMRPPTSAEEEENKALRLEVKLLKKQLLGYE